MRFIFFLKYSKFDVDLKNAQKKSENFFSCDKCVSIVCIKLSLLRRQYLSSSVNGLIKSLKTLHVIKSYFFQLNYLRSDQWIWYRFWRWDWIGDSARLPCCLSRGRLKRELFEIYLTTSFGCVNSEIHTLWESSFFENVENFMYIWKKDQKIQKMFLFLG